jgi:hypothetical protein
VQPLNQLVKTSFASQEMVGLSFSAIVAGLLAALAFAHSGPAQNLLYFDASRNCGRHVGGVSALP